MEYQYDGSVEALKSLAVGAALGTHGLVKELREWRRDHAITPREEAIALHECFGRLAIERAHQERPDLTQYDEAFWKLVARHESALLRSHGHRLYARLASRDAEAWWSFTKS